MFLPMFSHIQLRENGPIVLLWDEGIQDKRKLMMRPWYQALPKQ